MKKIIALLLAMSMVFALVACGGNNTNNGGNNQGNNQGGNNPSQSDDNNQPDNQTPDSDIITFEGDYTYLDWVSTLSANWNIHTYETSDQSYPIEFLTAGLYNFIFNDERNPVEGRAPYEGYVIVPEMAASLPVDVTEQIKAEGKFDIPASATSGYAYTIDLNPLATFEDGTKITADDYVESMKRLLDPKLRNYRAGGYYEGNFCIAGAEMYANSGISSEVTIQSAMDKDGLADMEAFLAAYGDAEAYINWSYSFGAAYDFATGEWGEAADEVVATGKTIAEFLPFFLDSAQTMNGADAETADAWSYEEVYVTWTYPEGVTYDTVGLYKSGDYQLTLVLAKSLAGFNLLYNLTSTWLVKTDLYDSCLREDVTASGSVWTSTYCTSAETTCSFGPYKMSSYQTDKGMHFVKNENWYGYTDGKHVYVDPLDGQTYSMYMTTEIDTQVVAEVATAKMMFLKGELMTYGLQPEDFDTYRNSEFCHFTPGQAVYFLMLNGNMPAIKEREAAADFDQAAYDLEILTLTSFHRAMGLTYDKDLFCENRSPADSGAFGLIGHAYIADPDTGAKYRDTEAAKMVLCEVYGIDPSKFASLDEAVDSITGYDPVAAKEWYNTAYNEALTAGFITDNDNDGICDQTIQLTYSASQVSENLTKNLDYLTEKANEVTAGTPFENKIKFVASAPLGNAWSDNIKAGLTDTCLSGWTGSAMDPFGLIEVYTNPAYQYDAAWFDATSVDMTLNINGKDVTMNLNEWTLALNGAVITTEDGVEHNYGDGIADYEIRVEILAGIEKAILLEYNYLPFMEDGSMALLTQKAYYVVEEYNPVMGRGGIAYLRYNYNDTEWEAYVAECGGELTY